MQKIKYVSGLFAVFLAFLSWRTIKSFIGEQTSDVAVLTINDEQVQQSIYEALLKLAEKAKEDPEIQAQLADLLRSSLDVAMKDEETMKILSEMAAEIIKSKEVMDAANDLTDDVIDKQLNNKENRELLSDTFYVAVYNATANALYSFKNFFMFWRR